MISGYINSNNARDISSELLMDNGKLKLLPAEIYSKYSWEEFRLFCHRYARYGLPTLELIDFLNEIIDGRDAIEIGAGSGDLGHYLNIKMTDSKLQEEPTIIARYAAMRQPVIKYPEDVEKIDALEAVIKYKPKVVVASWITPYSPTETYFASHPWGIKENEILKLVDIFIIVGNLDIHKTKPIRKIPHQERFAPWIISRAKNPANNCVMVWSK